MIRLLISSGQVHLRSTIHALPDGLDSVVVQGESSGQRSLICLARAILRENKILILDEATAKLDTSMEQTLYKTIREHFAKCTVITIAHRLHNILDSDRIMVVDGGRIVEFDHAHCLLQNDVGFLSKLIDETGAENAQYLRRVASEKWNHVSNSVQ